MNYAGLTPVHDSEFTPKIRFFGEPLKDGEAYYKIYHDGGHYVATRCQRSLYKPAERKTVREDIDILFDSLYFQATKDCLKDTVIDNALTDYIRTGILKLFPKFVHID